MTDITKIIAKAKAAKTTRKPEVLLFQQPEDRERFIDGTWHLRFLSRKYRAPLFTETLRPVRQRETIERWHRIAVRRGYTIMLDGDLMPTPSYAFLPEILALRTEAGLTLRLGDKRICHEVTDPEELRRAATLHGIAPKPCSQCGRPPVVNFTTGVLSHDRTECKVRVVMDDPEIPIQYKLALWDDFLSRRSPPNLPVPLLRRTYVDFGVLREPTVVERERRMRDVKVMEF